MAVECLHADERINLVLVLCEIMVELMFLSCGICGLMPIGPKLALSRAPHFAGVNWSSGNLVTWSCGKMEGLSHWLR